MALNVFSYLGRSDRILTALENYRWNRQLGKISPVVRQECYSCEMFRNFRIGATKTVGEFLCQFWPIRISHDHRCQCRRPSKIIAVEKFQQSVDILAIEAANIVAIVDIAG